MTTGKERERREEKRKRGGHSSSGLGTLLSCALRCSQWQTREREIEREREKEKKEEMKINALSLQKGKFTQMARSRRVFQSPPFHSTITNASTRSKHTQQTPSAPVTRNPRPLTSSHLLQSHTLPPHSTSHTPLLSLELDEAWTHSTQSRLTHPWA